MPFKPGNKHGRGRPPAGRALTDMLRVVLTEKGPDGATKLRKLADVLVNKALEGDMRAISEILDRLEGRPTIAADESATSSSQVTVVLTPADISLC